MTDVFKIVEVNIINSTTCEVKGRAYIDVRVGDIVFVKIFDRQGQFVTENFTIIGIFTYGKQVDELNKMLTGSLLLNGINNELLKQAKMLLATYL